MSHVHFLSLQMLQQLLLSLFLSFHLAPALIQRLTNPILPIKLKTTRIISTKYTFVSHLNISELAETKHDLDRHLFSLTEKRNLSGFAHQLFLARLLSSSTDNLLQSLYPPIRQKRGLINLGGKISKWLFGTLDADDGQKIDTIMNHLNNNAHLLQDKINDQISLTTEFMSTTYHSLEQIKSNVVIISRLISNYSEIFNEINALRLITDSFLILEMQLNQIINAIAFANLNQIHPIFLSSKNLNSIINKMKSIYPLEQIAKFQHQPSYYSFLGIQLIFKHERIIFLIHFPTLLPKSFDTYYILPIPLNNKILLLRQAYLTINERDRLYQYQEEPCAEIESTYYCKNFLQLDNDCIVNIMTTNAAPNCTTLPVRINKSLAHQVTPTNILFVTALNTIITESCSIVKHHELQPGSYLLTLTDGCYFTLDGEKFVHENSTLSPATIIQLPSLNISSVQELPLHINLDDLGLEAIRHISEKALSQHKIFLPSLQSNEGNSLHFWILLAISIIALVLIFVGITCYYRLCYPYPYARNNHSATTIDQPSQPSQPSLP